MCKFKKVYFYIHSAAFVMFISALSAYISAYMYIYIYIYIYTHLAKKTIHGKFLIDICEIRIMKFANIRSFLQG